MSTEEITNKAWEILGGLRHNDQPTTVPVCEGDYLYHVPFTPKPNGSWVVGEVTSQAISTEMPKGYTSWGKAWADARKAPSWDSENPLVKLGYFSRFECEHLYYRKAYLVAQAAMEAESAQAPQGALGP